MMAIAVVLLSLCGSVVAVLERTTELSLKRDTLSKRRLDTEQCPPCSAGTRCGPDFGGTACVSQHNPYCSRLGWCGPGDAWMYEPNRQYWFDSLPLACCGKGAIVTYKKVLQGRCPSGTEIKTMKECSDAGASLRLEDTTAKLDGTNGVSFDPPFCYYEDNELKFNGGSNHGLCSNSDECLCVDPRGTTAYPTGVNECMTNNGGCHAQRTCTNTATGASCGNCGVGWSNDGDKGCTDVNECLENNGGCHAMRKCVNMAGNSTCSDCLQGWTNAGSTGCSKGSSAAILSASVSITLQVVLGVAIAIIIAAIAFLVCVFKTRNTRTVPQSRTEPPLAIPVNAFSDSNNIPMATGVI